MVAPSSNNNTGRVATNSAGGPNDTAWRLPTTGWLFVTFLSFHAGRYWDVSGGFRCSRSVSLLRSVSNYYAGRDPVAQMVVQLPEESIPNAVALQRPPRKTKSRKNKNNKNNDGWHSIDVFYGNTTHLDARTPPPAFHGKTPSAIQDWYGQAQQDQIVYELLNKKKNGYFLDLAANDARTYSNTFALERHHNWTGLCIEPNPQYWHDLSYRDCQVVAAVVGRHRMEEVQFRFHTTGVLGGIVDDRFDLKTNEDKQHHPDAPPTLKYTVPLLEILQRYNVPKTIDYLSLDVEGAEQYILEIFPLEDYQIRVMTIERPSVELQAFLKRNGFGLVRQITRWGETLWAHESFLREQKLERQLKSE